MCQADMIIGNIDSVGGITAILNSEVHKLTLTSSCGESSVWNRTSINRLDCRKAKSHNSCCSFFFNWVKLTSKCIL